MSPHTQDRNFCSFCPKMCHFSCPVAEEEKNETLTPWGKQQNAKLILEKALPFNAQTALPAFKCVSCRISESFCEHEIPVADCLQEMRELSVANHTAPKEIFDFLDRFKKFSNPHGKDLQEKLNKLAQSSSLETGKDSILFFPSCHLTAFLPEALQLYFELFKKLGISNVKLFNENIQCCGFSLWNAGFKEDFLDLAELQWHALRDAEKIIVGSPECAWAFKHLYPEQGFPLRAQVFTVSEFLAPYLKNTPFKAKAKTPIKYFYHDSCYQGRYLKQYDEARELLEMVTGFEPCEFSWNKKESLCSGAGGTYALVEPEHAQHISSRHLQEMLDNGVKILVSSCPKSVHHFKQAMPGMIVKDLISFLAENILEESWRTAEWSVKTS
ncbi:MAG: (Fe-S)-binding protein [Deltaproteobacteria bacterium]|nr:(Fe-S)-binding protein [Deltaproteobacteria bacterium]